MTRLIRLLVCSTAMATVMEGADPVTQGSSGASPQAPVLDALISRKAWGGSEADAAMLKTHPMGTIRFISIHHSESPTPDPVDEVERVQRIQHGHMVADHQWGDIAYHYLIGPSGRIYEGRSPQYAASSGTVYLRPAVWSAAGQNELGVTTAPSPTNSAGEKIIAPGASAGHLTICFLGNFETGLPSVPAREAMARLVARQLKAHALTSAAVMFHREIACWTDCPGQALYDWFRGPARKRGTIGEGLLWIEAGTKR